MTKMRSLALGALLVALPISGSAAVIPEFHGGPDHVGVFPGPGPDRFFQLLWRFDAGHMVVSSPVIAEGVVIFLRCEEWRIYALDAKSGALKWKSSADAAITSTGAVSDGIVYFTSRANTVYALNAADGSLAWKRATGPDLPFDAIAGFDMAQDWDYWTSSPLAFNGRIFVGSGSAKSTR